MNENDWKKTVELFYEDKLTFGVDRVGARKFFTDLSLSKIESMIGEKPYFEKMAIMGAFISAPICLIAAIVGAFFAFGWLALLALIIYPAIYFSYTSDSSRGNSGNIFPLICLIGIAIAYFVFGEFTGFISIIFFVISLWLTRFVYTGATTFLRALMTRNYRAWELFNPQIVPFE